MNSKKMHMATKRTKIQNNQKGLASILVTLIIMIVISLIVIGFARLSRREQRQVLDDQLSTQAFYAAETAVNDAKNLIPNVDFSTNNYSSDCNAFMTDQHILSNNKNVLDAASGIKYTCLLVNPRPDDLRFDNVSTANATVAKLHAVDNSGNGTPYDTLSISWEDKNGSPNVSNCLTTTKFPPLSQWPAGCDTGVLRIDIVDLSVEALSYDRKSLADNTYTLFLYPQPNGTGLTTYNLPYPLDVSNNGILVPVNCNHSGTRLCTLQLRIPPVADGAIRMKSIYEPSSVTIQAYYTGNKMNLTGDQVVIDATGKANDVLRRIQVRVPVSNNQRYPDFAIQSGDTICKRLLIAQSGGVASFNASPSNPDSCDPFQ